MSRVIHEELHYDQKQCSVCLLFTLHASLQTTNYPKTTKSALTKIPHKTKNTQTSNTNLGRIRPFGIAPINFFFLKAHKARTQLVTWLISSMTSTTITVTMIMIRILTDCCSRLPFWLLPVTSFPPTPPHPLPPTDFVASGICAKEQLGQHSSANTAV